MAVSFAKLPELLKGKSKALPAGGKAGRRCDHCSALLWSVNSADLHQLWSTYLGLIMHLLLDGAWDGAVQISCHTRVLAIAQRRFGFA